MASLRLSWHLPVEHLSASSMGSFMECPERFRRKYILKEPEKSFSGRFIGSVDHRVNARIFKGRMPKSLDSTEPFSTTGTLIEDTYREVWDEVLEQDGEPDWQDDDPTKMFERGVRMAKTYQEQVGKDIVPVAVESRFEFKLDGVPVPIIGYIDVMEADKVRERKTSAVKQTSPKPAWRFQGLVYQLATGMPVWWDVCTRQATTQIYSARDWPDLQLPLGDFEKTKRLIKDCSVRMNDLYARFGRDEVWPTTGIMHSWACNFCPAGPKFRGDCLAWQ